MPSVRPIVDHAGAEQVDDRTESRRRRIAFGRSHPGPDHDRRDDRHPDPGLQSTNLVVGLRDQADHTVKGHEPEGGEREIGDDGAEGSFLEAAVA